MGDMLPQENVRVGQIRNTCTMMAFLKLFSDLPMKKKVSAKSSCLGGVFCRFRALKGAPGVTNQ